MRQVGVLAAAALHAIDHHRARLPEDHHRARRLAGDLRGPGLRVAEPVTNAVIVEIEDPELGRDALLRELRARGVLMVAFGDRRIRAMAHLDVDDAAVARAAEAFREAVAALRHRRSPVDAHPGA